MSSVSHWAGYASSLAATALLAFGGVGALVQARASAASVPVAHDYRDRNFDYFVTGDPSLPRAQRTQFGLALMGGGGSVDEAFRFIARHAGGGHIVVLGAVGDDSFDPTDGKYGPQFAKRWGPVASTQTFIFHNRAAASDPRVIEALRNADGIFLMGGDQGDYIRYWKGTPVQAALDAHVAAGRPIGGSSAGLAILGRYSYGSLDAGSMESKTALADPFDAGMTLEDDFLHFHWLETVVTDTHFSARHRLGRLAAFLARFEENAPAPGVFGVGVDEQTALLIEPDGVGHVAKGSVGSVWVLIPQGPARILKPAQPLSMDNIRLYRLGEGGEIRMDTRAVSHPAAEAVISIDQGKLTHESIASPIFLRASAPPGES
ncbi:MAG: cyanophycinase [Caulobacteraceae bacterium]|nr:cyanophycinase [Caulobacteraceae bacterium]